ncbi:adenylate cyclase [Sinorhizobium sp. BG8]|uniref:adenylate cyclase n=1 Tax=Sinorhizobium sp. BG8 TaxID=2613773 RepID=UPI00193DC44E|nr:adenylate cyclase [Sinorhizobium sp. BG8]QRM57470.1 adenylate cyclase [Sinorhizobium sp. BG8]
MRTSMSAERDLGRHLAVSPPTPDDIRAQLERIVTSPEFPAVGRGSAFLSYVIEETLAGRAQRIKGYSVAIEVFKRDQGFTQDDPVVRIEAGRLRRALERYYLVAGQNDPVWIEIPKGGYVPSFAWNDPVATEPHEAAPALPAAPVETALPPSRWRRLLTSLGSAVVAAAAVVFVYWVADRPESGASLRGSNALAPEGPTLVVAPFADLGEGPEARLYAAGLTEELLTALPRFKELTVFGRETSKSLVPEVDVATVRGELGAQYLLAGGLRVAGSRVRVTARLLETETGTILWSQIYDDDLQTRGLFAIQSDVADKVATAVAQPYGIISQADAANPPPDDIDAYGCTLRFYAYRAELSMKPHAEVRECLESAIARYPSYATAWAMLSIVYLDEDRFKFNVRSSSPKPLERALRAARRAVQLDPGNTRALQALMTALFFNQQLEESLRAGEQALATNPNDTELMGEFATRLALGGQWKRGAEILNLALARNPGGAGYYHGMLALADYMQGDYEAAATEIKLADLQKFPFFHLVAAVIYAERGMTGEAAREGAVFVEMRPQFLANITAELASRNVRPGDQIRLVDAMRKAGLPVPEGEVAISEVPAIGSDLQPR